jgi:hypothetical protein
MARYTSVEEYLAAIPPPLRQAAEATRAAIDAAFGTGPDGSDGTVGPDARTCRIRWSHPTWSVGRTPVCYLRAASRHVTLGFWKGACLQDPAGRLESAGQVMAHVKVRSADHVDPGAIASWVKQALALEAAG